MNINVTTFDLLLRKNGLTQAALAERAHIGAKTIGRIRRKEPLRTTNVKKIAEALGVTIEELIAPPTETLTEKAEKKSGLHRLVMDLDGQTINALTLTASYYRVSEKAVLSAAPLMFSILAELSLKKRRDKLAAWEEATLAAVEMAPKTHEDFAADGIGYPTFWDLYYTERDSIAARDLSGGFSGEHPNHLDIYSIEGPGNPFLETLEALASEAGSELAFFGNHETISENFYEGHYDAFDELFYLGQAHDHTLTDDTRYPILSGNILLREIPESLFKPENWPELEAWVREHPNVQRHLSGSAHDATAPEDGESNA